MEDWTAETVRRLRGFLQNKLPKFFAKRQKQVVKSRPVHLEDHYEVLNDESVADGLFLRLRRSVFRQIDEYTFGVRPKYLRESGRISATRPYFFIQPFNGDGWLFERSNTGWVVSRAQKIVESETFMRAYEPWDIVTVYQTPNGKGTPRISSQKLKANLVSFAVYEQLLADSMPVVDTVQNI